MVKMVIYGRGLRLLNSEQLNDQWKRWDCAAKTLLDKFKGKPVTAVKTWITAWIHGLNVQSSKKEMIKVVKLAILDYET
jgi:hypothetical protein